MADEKGNESESDDSQPQLPNQLKDSSDEGKPAPPSCPNEPSQAQTVGKPLGRGVERQLFGASGLCSNPLTEEEKLFGASALCSNPLTEEETFFLPARAGPIDNIESLGPVWGWG